MQLIYRGTTLNYTPSQSVAHRPFQQIRQPGAAYNLRYRGITYQVDPNIEIEKVFEQPRTYELCYRGLKYRVNRNEQGEVIAITTTAIAPTHKATTTAYSTNQQVEKYSL